MTPLLINILLALVWTAMSGVNTLSNFALGFVVGYLILFMQQEVAGSSSYYRKVNQFLSFLAYFLKEMMVASLRVTFDTITLESRSRPAIIALPVDAETDLELMILSNVISLTPGSLTIDISDDRKTLYIHAMFAEDPDKLRAEIKEGLEKRLLEVMR